MKLKQGLSENNRSLSWLADCLGISISKVNRHIADENFPAPMCFQIYELSEQMVLPHELSPSFFPVEKIKEIYGCPHCWTLLMDGNEVIGRLEFVPKHLRALKNKVREPKQEEK